MVGQSSLSRGGGIPCKKEAVIKPTARLDSKGTIDLNQLILYVKNNKDKT
ncbi:hypothetical protein HCUR_00732 [Holospora curviuscula]|uniref:Uncharacterized protein n=1 Tax=Holospora curviuscula TaxID=1082868 RepID=A0A2S5R949_9PROT|nr:hypothetical protein HCUR_00732 [Holospora curviuscula]